VAAERGSQDSDDVRRKFREALDRKAARNHASAQGAGHDGSHKSHGTPNPTQGRQFRRKTG
jgi:hypothetical protein